MVKKILIIYFLSFQFNVNDTLERPSRVSFIKFSEESNESCQGIVIQHVFPQVITIAEERTIFLPATSVKKCPWNVGKTLWSHLNVC